MRYIVTDKLFTFLYLFKDNTISLNEIISYLDKSGIIVNDIKAFLSRNDMKNLLTPSATCQMTPSKQNNIYHSLSPISKYTEYTPERIDFLITRKCNLRCRHCFENASPMEETPLFNMDTMKNIFRQMDDLNIKTLKITGGEPFMHPQIYPILEEIALSRFETIILTNGMLIDDMAMNIIKSANIKLGISLDGISSNAHDYLRGNGAFNIIFKKLKLLGALGIDLTLTFTVNKINEKEIEDFASIAFHEIGVRCIFINRLRPIGRAKCDRSMFIPDNEYALIKKRVEKLTDKYGKMRISLSDDSIPLDGDNMEQLTDKSPLVCAAGNTLMCMDQHYDVCPCIYGQGNREFIMGNLVSDSLLKIWQSDKWKPFRGGTVLSQIRECNTCKKKEKCGIKNCRLKPIYNGLEFYDHVTYCKE